MRVLQVIPGLAPRDGGPTETVLGLCRGLSRAGVEATIAATNADGEGVLAVPTGRVIEYAGTNVIVFSRRGGGFKYSGPLARWLTGAVGTFDVVHIHAVFSHASLAAGRACRTAGVPYVLRPLGSLMPWALRRKAWRKAILLRTSARALIGGAAAMHFASEDERRLAQRVTGTVRGEVIPPGIDDRCLARPIVAPAARERRVVTLARLHPVKRLETLIDAFHRVAACAPLEAWRLTLAGDGDAAYRDELQRRAAAGPASTRIDFAGWLDADARAALLDRASIFVLPSQQESFGLGVAEALARGVPAIVSTGVSLAPAIESADAGWVVGSGTEALASALAEAMRDDRGRARRAAAARAWASASSWERAVPATIALYESVRVRPAEGHV